MHADAGDEATPHSLAISNHKLHLPLTKVAWRRLDRVVARWAVAFGGGGSDATLPADLQPPGDDPEGSEGAAVRPPDRVSILGEVDEDAFAGHR